MLRPDDLVAASRSYSGTITARRVMSRTVCFAISALTGDATERLPLTIECFDDQSDLGKPSCKPVRMIGAALAGSLVLAACGGSGGGSGGNPSALDDSGELDPDGSDLPSSSGEDTPPDPGAAEPDPGAADDVPAPTIDLASLGAAVELSAEHADVPGSAFYVNANNAARLQGPMIGSGSEPNDSLGRALPFTVETSAPGLELMQAGIYPSDDDSVLIGVIENRSDTLHCFVRFDDYALYDRAGNALELTYDFAYARGTVGSSDVTSDISIPSKSCIEPGGKVFLSDRIRHPVDEIGGFVVRELASDTAGFQSETAVAEPVSYEATTRGISVLVANRGSVSINPGPSRVIFLDEDGYPLGDTILSGDSLMPGEEDTYTWSNIRFSGRASTVRVVIDFQRDVPD